ncbi:MarR family transcriptional regulator [Maricaulis sp.]|uniref:MarR family winged helix-turn-helix transcriptional regulator n=1 Tax=Maricaulis sp. TaxID=1486257 RepID=UPI00261BDBC8|nr:MarR family transcriptional regulator [Maricaulis sp.]
MKKLFASDFLASLGHTALGSRLKRLGLALQAESQAWLETQDCSLASAQMPVLAALSRQNPLTTGQLATMLGIAQPGVSRMIADMEKGGWVLSRPGKADRRVREIILTDQGEALAARARTDFWPRIEAAAAAVCEGIEGGLLDQIGVLEQRMRSGQFRAALDREDAQ